MELTCGLRGRRVRRVQFLPLLQIAFDRQVLLEGAVRDGYRPLRHPVSSLALRPRGWIQAGNFAMAGTLFLAGAAGPARPVILRPAGQHRP